MCSFQRLHKGFPVETSATHVSHLTEVGDFKFHGYILDEEGPRYTDYRSTMLPTHQRVYMHGTPVSGECPGPGAKIPTTYDLVYCVEGTEIAHQFRFIAADRADAMGVHDIAIAAIKGSSDKELINQKILDEIVRRGLASRK